MITQRYHLYIERIDRPRNMARFYALSIEPTLFGEAALMRRWGRIGSRGQLQTHVFPDEKQAVGLFLDLVRQKRARGYRPKAAVDRTAIADVIPRYVNDKPAGS